jgi:hypothetical protein
MTRNLPAVTENRRLASSEGWRGMSTSARMGVMEEIKVFAPDAREYLTDLDDRLRNGPVTSGKSGILMTGEHGLGKHALIRHLATAHGPVPTETIPSRKLIVVPPTYRTDPASLTEAILAAANWPFRERISGGVSPAFQVNKVCQALGTRALIFDRSEFLCTERGIAPEAVPFLVGVMDEGKVLVVLVGPRELEKAVKKSEALSGKFFKWRLEPIPYGRYWTATVTQFDKAVPFQDGCLTRPTIPERFYLASLGKPPTLARVTIEAARKRFKTKKSHDIIEIDEFYRAYAEYDPDARNPFDPKITMGALMEEIERGPRATVEDFRGTR